VLRMIAKPNRRTQILLQSQPHQQLSGRRTVGRGAQPKWYTNGKEVDQGVARKAQQKPEGEMEATETAAAAEAP